MVHSAAALFIQVWPPRARKKKQEMCYAAQNDQCDRHEPEYTAEQHSFLIILPAQRSMRRGKEASLPVLMTGPSRNPPASVVRGAQFFFFSTDNRRSEHNTVRGTFAYSFAK